MSYNDKVTVIPKTPNPLFEKFLQEFIEDATDIIERENLENALSSLRKFPILLRSGHECFILEHFDNRLCRMLDERFESYKQKPDERFESYRQKPDSPIIETPEILEIENDEKFTFTKDNYKIFLIVDKKETLIKGNKDFVQLLEQSSLNYSIRHLTVGDYLWIAQNPEGKEVVLPYIIERKRIDDMYGSIKDGRYREQKFRLKRCGLKVIYLLEQCAISGVDIPLATLRQAIINTMVADQFTINITKSLKESLLYLKHITIVLTEMFKGKILKSCSQEEWLNHDRTFEGSSISLLSLSTFNKLMAKPKNYTVKEMTIKMLLELHGVSVEKAVAIVSKYPSIKHLINSFVLNGPELLTNIEYGLAKRKIGPVISHNLHSFFVRDFSIENNDML